MLITSRPTQASEANGVRHQFAKPALWLVMGAATLSVVFYTEIPLLRQAKERAYLSTIYFLIVPHIIAGVTAFFSGPLQFSSRIRQRYPQFHRILGRVYVAAVFIAAPFAIALAANRRAPHVVFFFPANVLQAGTWMVTTAAAFLTARNRHFQQHREWMVRSYAVTFTFVGTRVLQPIPAWNRHTEAGFAMEIVLVTFMAVLIPDIALHWRQITSRKTA
jgi:uncharacterized membrane protein